MYVPDNYDAYMEYIKIINEDETRRRKKKILEEQYDVDVEEMI